MKKGANRFLVPFLSKVKFDSMHNQKGIDKHKEMMRVPKGIETN
jgi:hypothetical protein